MQTQDAGLVRHLLTRFGLGNSAVRPVQMERGKAVWRVDSPRGPVCLKECHHDHGRMLFALGGQHHAHNAGAPVPAVLPARDGSLVVDAAGRLFCAFQWLDGRRPRPGRREEFAAMVQALARFHRCSRGYQPPEGARVSSKWGRWPQHYRTMCRQMAEYRELARQYFGRQAGQVLPLFDHHIALGEQAREQLLASPYPELTAAPEATAPLNHQDYGPGNAVITPGGTYVIDLDGVTYDLPARDLRKLAFKVGQGAGWQPAALLELLRWYEGEAPLTPAERQCLLADLAFPHGFHATVKNLRKRTVGIPAITRSARQEQEKRAALPALVPWSQGR